jgi:hypothetical protein
MRHIRLWLGAFLALAFAAVSGTIGAQNIKKFDLGAPTTIGVTQTTIAVTFKNLDTGNSSFNSIGIKGTASGTATLTINSASASPGGPGTPANLGDGYFYLTGIAPVKKGQTLTVTLNVTMTGNGCSNGSISWQGRAFTGSPSQPSTEFQQNNANPVTVVTMGCAYSVSGTTPASMSRGTTGSLAIRVTNAAASPATITSVGLTPPAGITTTGSPYSVNITAGNYADVDVPSTASCNTSLTGGAWGSSVTGFTKTGGDPSTSLSGSCSLQYSGAPSSVIPSQQFSITVTATDALGGTMTGFTGNIALSATTTGCTLAGTTSGSALNGARTFSNISLTVNPDVGTCNLKATATIDGQVFETFPQIALKVFDGVLTCNVEVPQPKDALSLPADVGTQGSFRDGTSGNAGFIAGLRGAGNDKNNASCTDINYALYNNVSTPDGGGDLIDPAGNVVPPGYFSFTWDTSQASNPVVAILTTYRSEWGDAVTGLPTRQTKVCSKTLPDVCTSAADYQVVQACEGTAIERASVPDGQAACLASEGWRVVPVGDAQYCTGTAPSAPPSPPANWAPRCLQMTSIVILGKDPVFGR